MLSITARQHSASHNNVGSTSLKTRPFTTPGQQEIYIYMLQTLHVTEAFKALVLCDIQGPPWDQGPSGPSQRAPASKGKESPGLMMISRMLCRTFGNFLHAIQFPKAKILPSVPRKEPGHFVPQEVPELKRIYILSKVLNSQEAGWSWQHRA